MTSVQANRAALENRSRSETAVCRHGSQSRAPECASARHSNATRLKVSFGIRFPDSLLPFALIFVMVLSGCGRTNPQPPSVSVASLDPASVRLIERAREAVLASPKSADAWGKLGQTFHATEFLREAAECYLRAVQLAPDSARWRHLLSLLQLSDQPEEALRGLARAAELAGSQTDAPRVRLIQALVERGRLDEAQAPIQALLARNPVHPAARLESARACLVRNDLDAAASALEPCLTNTLTERPAILLLSQIRQRQGDAAAAAELSQRAGKMPRPFDWPDPFLREVQSLRVDRQKLVDQVNQLLIQRRLQEANAALVPLLDAFPSDPECLLLLGRLRLMERNCSAAEETLRRHLEIQPDSLNGLMQLALAILCQERWAEAVVPLRKVILLKPDFAPAHYNLGFALARMGDSGGAIRSFREALRANPGDFNTRFALAEELFLSGQSVAAAQELDRAEALNAADPRVGLLREKIQRGR